MPDFAIVIKDIIKVALDKVLISVGLKSFQIIIMACRALKSFFRNCGHMKCALKF